MRAFMLCMLYIYACVPCMNTCSWCMYLNNACHRCMYVGAFMHVCMRPCMDACLHACHAYLHANVQTLCACNVVHVYLYVKYVRVPVCENVAYSVFMNVCGITCMCSWTVLHAWMYVMQCDALWWGASMHPCVYVRVACIHALLCVWCICVVQRMHICMHVVNICMQLCNLM